MVFLNARPASRFTPALRLRGARTEQHKPQVARLDESVDFVQQRRQPLHLVHDHPVIRRRIADGLREQRRISEQILV